VAAFRSVTEQRFGTGGFNSLRGPGMRNLDLNVTRTLAMGGARTLQLKVEIFNVFNRPMFASPTRLNISDVQFNPDGWVRNLNGVASSTRRSTPDGSFRNGMCG
jgi:hypothetical protein